MTQHSIRVYVDLEYCTPIMEKGSPRPTESDQRQIVQIAAIKYDHSQGKEVGEFEVFCRPKYTNNLPAFFTELTGITQAVVDTYAVELGEGIGAFEDFCEGYPVYTFDKDWGVFMQNCGYIKRKFLFSDTPFQRVKPMLAAWGLDPEKYSSGTLYKAAGLTMDGHVHNALHDVKSMAAAVDYFERSS